MGAVDGITSEDEITFLWGSKKRRKPPRHQNVWIELLKYGSKKVMEYIKGMFNKIVHMENTSKECNMSYTSIIYKRGDRELCLNYRGINVILLIARFFSSILRGKTEEDVTGLWDEQNRFGLSGLHLDNIHSLRVLVENNFTGNVIERLIWLLLI